MTNAEYFAIIESTMTIALSLIYFKIFLQERDQYIGWWGFGWVFFSISFIFDLYTYHLQNFSIYLIGKQLLYLISSSLLLVGTYGFIRKKMPILWDYLSSPPMIAVIFFAYILFPSMPLLNMLSLLVLSLVSIWTGIAILINSNKNAKLETNITGWLFIIWGSYKGIYPLFLPTSNHSQWDIIISAVLTNLLSVFILMLYFEKIKYILKENERKFRLLAENAKDMIYRYRVSTKDFDYVSPAALEITGYAPEIFYNTPELFFHNVYEADQNLMNIIRSAEELDESLVIRWRRKDGKIIWTEQQYSVIYDTANNPEFIEGILRDITERKNVEENLFKSEASRKYLLTNISHELRTPITAILGYVTAMLDGIIANTPEQIHNYLTLIQTKSLILQRLISDLFQLTQMEAGQFSYNYSIIPVKELMMQTFNKFQQDATNAKIRLHLSDIIDMNSTLQSTYILVDTERIEQVFSNLIFNAIHHANNASDIWLQCSIDCSQDSGPNNIIIDVRNNGDGIASDELANIFDRFYKGAKKKKSAHKDSAT